MGNKEKDERDEQKARNFMQLARLSSVGLELGIAITIGWAVGYFLDRWLGTTPWLMIVFLLFGVAAGFKGVYITAREASRSGSESKEQRKDT